jgi:thioredoxin reductase (NADPH)
MMTKGGDMAHKHNDECIVLYGADWCSDCRRAKQFFGEHRIPFEWIDIVDNDEAVANIEELTDGKHSIPVIVFPDGDILVEPSNMQLAEKTGVDIRPQANFHDVIIIGGGPAGLTAAIYTAREGLNTLVIEAAGLGGQVATTQVLDNFLGFPEGVTGQNFTERMEEQARRFGVDIIQGEEIADIVRDDRYLVVKSVNDREYIAQSVVIATGSKYSQLNVGGEWELIGSQVHFCATCDGAFYKNKDILVIGGGNSGFEEGLFLADRFAKSVKIVEFLPEAKASQILQEKAEEKDNIEVVLNHAVQEFKVKDGKLDGVVVQDRATGEVHEWHPDGVFVFIGLKPNTGFLPDTIKRNEWGFLETDMTLMTSMRGVFGAGDVRAGSTKQAISAAGEGATAAMMIRHYLKQTEEMAATDEAQEKELVVE